MKNLIAFLFLFCIALSVYAQNPFFPNAPVEPTPPAAEPEPEGQMVPIPIPCMTDAAFQSFLENKKLGFTSFYGKSHMIPPQHKDKVSVVFYYNAESKEFAIVRTMTKVHCIMEYGVQSNENGKNL